MRIRSIKPEFWRSNDIAAMNREQRLLFVGLWSYVDDDGVGRDELSAIIGDLFSSDVIADPAGTLDYVKSGLKMLAEKHLVTRYVFEGHGYLKITNWTPHQRIDHPNKSRYPSPDDAFLEKVSGDPREVLAQSSEIVARGGGEQRNRGTEEQRIKSLKEGAGRASHLPADWVASEDLLSYAERVAPSVRPLDEAEKFRDYWLASGRPNSVKRDWDAAFRTWLRKAHQWNVDERGWTEPGKEWLYQ